MTPFEVFNTAISQVNAPQFDGPTPKMLFICGPPRSGTTILCQSLCYCGEVGYINNLIARFATNPIIGVVLSRALNLPKTFTGRSEFGVTEGLNEPHEFGIGWSKLLSPSGITQPLPGTPLKTDSIQNLEQLGRSFERPVVFKSFAYLWYLKEIANAIPQACFVRVSRDIALTAKSLEKLYIHRTQNGVTPDWVSAVMRKTVTQGYSLDLTDKCLLQVSHIDTHIQHCFAEINSNQKIEVTLENYLNSPSDTVSEIFNYFEIPFALEKAEVL